MLASPPSASPASSSTARFARVDLLTAVGRSQVVRRTMIRAVLYRQVIGSHTALRNLTTGKGRRERTVPGPCYAIFTGRPAACLSLGRGIAPPVMSQ
eukprot:1591918-Alexandrium_andersonii.AAC.1